MSTMSDRKAELEKKKAKLQAFREEKERRRREREQRDVRYNIYYHEYLVTAFINNYLKRNRPITEFYINSY